MDAIGETLSRLIYSENDRKLFVNENSSPPSQSSSFNKTNVEKENLEKDMKKKPKEEEEEEEKIVNSHRLDRERIDSVIRGRHVTQNDNFWTLPTQLSSAALFNLTGLNIVIWILLALILIFLLLLIYLLCLICCNRRR